MKFTHHRLDITRTRAVGRLQASCDAVAAFKDQLIAKLRSAAYQKIHRIVAAIEHHAQKIGMVKPEPVFYGISDKKLLAVFDALRYLKFIHRSGHISAVDDGISARATHFFKH